MLFEVTLKSKDNNTFIFTTEADTEELANKKLIAVQKKKADLLLLEQALEEHLSQCQNNDDDSHCPIIDSLQPK